MQDLRPFRMVKKKPDCNSCWEREAQIGHSRRIWFDEKSRKYITKPTTDLVVEEPDSAGRYKPPKRLQPQMPVWELGKQ